jgi:peptidylprolyl isomerase
MVGIKWDAVKARESPISDRIVVAHQLRVTIVSAIQAQQELISAVRKYRPSMEALTYQLQRCADANVTVADSSNAEAKPAIPIAPADSKNESASVSKAQPPSANLDGQNSIVIDTTKGRIVFELRTDLAPRHAERIKQLAREGYYNNVPFHRVTDGFMAQTGDGQNFNGTGGSKYPNLKQEFSKVPFTRGIVGMARRGDSVDSANSQFFIMFAEGSSLNGQYTVIGEVGSGMDVVDKLKKAPPGSSGGQVTDPDKMVKVQVATDITSARADPLEEGSTAYSRKEQSAAPLKSTPQAERPATSRPALALATNEISVRSCEVQAKAIGENMGRDFARQGVDPATLKAAARNMCLLVEQEMYEKVSYTIPVVPTETRNACTLIMGREEQPSYETMAKCLDKALAGLATLPSGSATLQRVGKPDRHFWTATECSIHQSASGSVCLMH